MSGDMATKVTALFDDVVPGHADEQIVERLEELLAQAKAGEVVGLGFAVVFNSRASATWWRAASWESIAAAVGTLHHRIFS